MFKNRYEESKDSPNYNVDVVFRVIVTGNYSLEVIIFVKSFDAATPGNESI